MTEDLLHGFWIEVGFKGDRCEAVAELMGGCGYAGSFSIFIIKGDKAAIGKRCLAVVAYNIFVGLADMLYQLVTKGEEERNYSVARFGLGCFYDRFVSVMGDGFGDVDIILFKIYILPLEGEYLSLSHTRHKGNKWEEPEIDVVLDNLLVGTACRLTRRFWQVCGGLDGSAGIQFYVSLHYRVVKYSVHDHSMVADDFLRIALLGESGQVFLNILGGYILCGGVIEKSNGAAHRQLIRADRLERKLWLCFFPPFIGDLAEASADLCFLSVKHYFFIDLALGLAVKIYALVCTRVYDGFTEPTVCAGS